MILIDCPHCGVRDHSEFTYGGDGGIEYPALDAPAEAWHTAVYQRGNPKGLQIETWQHSGGCRLWLKVQRDTVTHEIHSVVCAHHGMQTAARPEESGAKETGSDNTGQDNTGPNQ